MTQPNHQPTNSPVVSPAPGMRDTPMLRQYLEIKEQVPDCLLFFHMGDFYEMFFEDALTASKVLAIALTSRDKGQPDPVPMCGVPCRAVDLYLAKLVEAGFKVAVCDQMEDPKKAKGLVKREVTRVVSPGMFLDPERLPARDHRYLVALLPAGEEVGLAALDLTSGEFQATALPAGPPLVDELFRLAPVELALAASQANHPVLANLGEAGQAPKALLPGRPPSPAEAAELLADRLPEGALDGGGIPGPALQAAALAYHLVLSGQRRAPLHLERLGIYRVDRHLVLDQSARRNLEIFRSIAGGGRAGSLLAAVDRTATSMGSRLLGEWLGFPLRELAPIEERLSSVDELLQAPLILAELRERLAALPDLPRLVGRAALGSATPRDLGALRDALALLPGLLAILAPLAAPLLRREAARLAGQDGLADRLEAVLVEEPPPGLGDGGVIAPGVDPELDRQRTLKSEGKDFLAGLQARLRAETGIGSLKVGFNKVFGYYLEVTKSHLDKVPASFIRKQTTAGGERYFTPELKEWEAAVLGAEERALALERELFEALRQEVAARSQPLMALSRALATLDVLAGLAHLAQTRGYVRPVIREDGRLEIVGGRHPVVEAMLKEGEFVPNDLRLGGEEQVLIITGPNMAGKSTILRQAAIIVLLAQAGAFVPAERAAIPLTDRIFTRVGAMDDLARGRSTFMVEMTETSQILKNATPRSLVILDEVGRGTSTFDGLSLAWAVAEHLHDLGGVGVKTLFATHYHELTELARELPRVRNYNVAVKEYQGGIVFLRKLKPGGVSRSYGLQVARLAGLPESVLRRAREILRRLEDSDLVAPAAAPAGQLSLFTPTDHPVLMRLRELDLSTLTPLNALNLLDELKRALD